MYSCRRGRDAGQRDAAGVGDGAEHHGGGLDVGVRVLHVDRQPGESGPRQEPRGDHAAQREPRPDLRLSRPQCSLDRIGFQGSPLGLGVSCRPGRVGMDDRASVPRSRPVGKGPRSPDRRGAVRRNRASTSPNGKIQTSGTPHFRTTKAGSTSSIKALSSGSRAPGRFWRTYQAYRPGSAQESGPELAGLAKIRPRGGKRREPDLLAGPGVAVEPVEGVVGEGVPVVGRLHPQARSPRAGRRRAG